jgi:hypothetical protein
MAYVIGFYELGLEYGGPEEGGWYYETGDLVRTFAVVQDREEAHAKCRRANDLLQHIQRNKRAVSSVLYRGGRYGACLYEDKLPEHYPTTRPRYE